MLEENEDALELWINVSTQFRIGTSGPVGIDYLALSRVAEWLDLEVDEALFRKIRVLEADFLNQFYGNKNEKRSCSHPEICSMCRKRCADRATMQ